MPAPHAPCKKRQKADAITLSDSTCFPYQLHPSPHVNESSFLSQQKMRQTLLIVQRESVRRKLKSYSL